MLGNLVSTKPHNYLKHLWASLHRQPPKMKVNSHPNDVHMEQIDKHKQTQKLLTKKIRTMKGKDHLKRRKRKVRLYLMRLKLEKKRRKSEWQELIIMKIIQEGCRRLIYESLPKTRQKSYDKYRTQENSRILSTIKHSWIEILMMSGLL